MNYQNQLVSRERQREAFMAAMRPIAPFLRDGAVREVMYNPPPRSDVIRQGPDGVALIDPDPEGYVVIDRAGEGLQVTDVRLRASVAEDLLRRIASSRKLELNDAHPTLSCKPPFGGFRVEGAIPPVVRAPAFSIRKQSEVVFGLADFVRQQFLTQAQSDLLQGAVRERKSILVSGGTGSGKTTFVNALLQVAEEAGDRVLTIEDTEELRCSSPKSLQLYVDDAVFTYRAAVKSAMRHRPDRIVIGELRDGGATQEWLKSLNTGHEGGIATVHATSAPESLLRLCQLQEEVVPRADRRLIAGAIQVCVHLQRDYSRPAGCAVGAIDTVLGCEGGDFHLTTLAAA